MSWVTDKAAIVSNLEGLGYSEVPRGQDVEELETFNHKCFTVRFSGVNTNEITSRGYIHERKAVINVVYVNKKNADYDANADLFIALIAELKTLAVLVEIESADFALSETTKLKSIGTIEIIYGVRSC